jgi:hypothetical protein
MRLKLTPDFLLHAGSVPPASSAETDLQLAVPRTGLSQASAKPGTDGPRAFCSSQVRQGQERCPLTGSRCMNCPALANQMMFAHLEQAGETISTVHERKDR